MEKDSNALILRVFVSSTDKVRDGLLYEHIVFKAKEFGLSGATVLKGILGYGASSIIHSIKFWELSEKVPTVIEIIDEETKILAFYKSIEPILDGMRYGCLVTTEKTDILKYKTGKKRH